LLAFFAYDDQDLAYFDDFTFFGHAAQYGTLFRGWKLNVDLVGHYFNEGLILLYLVAFFHKPLYDFAFGDSFTNIRQAKFEYHLPSFRSDHGQGLQRAVQ
jgi:hypothetical protein